jgi:hypothetical protein
MNDRTRTARIEALVAAYGTNVDRWPAPERALAPSQEALDAMAGAAEATALGRLLGEAAARQPASAPHDLIEAILAKAGTREAASSAAVATPGTAGAASDVLSLPEGAARRAAAQRPTAIYRAPAAAAALMAASLAVGLFMGSLTTTQTTVARIGTLAGLDLPAATGSVTFEDDFLAQDEEDIL